MRAGSGEVGESLAQEKGHGITRVLINHCMTTELIQQEKIHMSLILILAVSVGIITEMVGFPSNGGEKA